MAGSSRLRSSHRLFTLLAHGACVILLSGLLLTPAAANADALSELYACGGTFDSDLNSCLSAYYTCMMTAVTSQEVQACVTAFDNCGSDSVSDYAECLGGVEMISPCWRAREAMNQCDSQYSNCDAAGAQVAAAQGMPYECLDAYFECTNASGISQCE